MSTGRTSSGEIVQQRIKHEWTHVGANVFGRRGDPWSARLVVAAGQIRRDKLDAAFLHTNEPAYTQDGDD